MKTKKIRTGGFRNLQSFDFVPGDNVNVIWGDNAQGKTNLLEAIWLFTGGRSFRGARDCEMITIGGAFAKLDMDFSAQEREQDAEIKIADKRLNILNGIAKSSSAGIIGSFCAVVFSPVHLSLVKGGPEERRKFLDAAICQARPGYASMLSKYNKTLRQRNSLLKELKYNHSLYHLLDVWEDELVFIGSQIVLSRISYLEDLSAEAKAVYSGISSGKEQLDLKYASQSCKYSMKNSEICGIMNCQIKKAREDDIRSGHTSVGPHRDDIEIMINCLPVRNYGSQGQQRSCVLALKLAESAMLKNVYGEYPVALLDDVMSELDTGRQDYLLNRLKGSQVFITCCDPSPLMRLTSGRSFQMVEGELKG